MKIIMKIELKMTNNLLINMDIKILSIYMIIFHKLLKNIKFKIKIVVLISRKKQIKI